MAFSGVLCNNVLIQKEEHSVLTRQRVALLDFGRHVDRIEGDVSAVTGWEKRETSAED